MQIIGKIPKKNNLTNNKIPDSSGINKKQNICYI